MRSPEKNIFIRAAGVGSIAWAVLGCVDAAPGTVPDSASARVISYTPEPTATSIRPALFKTEEDLRLNSGRQQVYAKLNLTNWSRTNLWFNTQRLEHWMEQCGTGNLPGSVQIKFVLSHPWPAALEVAPGTREVSMSVALGALSELDINAHFIAGLCVGTDVSKAYRQGGKLLTSEQIRNRVTHKADDFRQAIQTGEFPRAITIRAGGN